MLTVINDERSEEFVARETFHETRSNHRAADRDSRQNTTATTMNDKAVTILTNESDLVNLAENSCSSVRSVYFPPNPPSVSGDIVRFGKGRRVSADVLLKLYHELGPLRCQLGEIVGKARALGLNDSNLNLHAYRYSDQRLGFFDRSNLLSSPSGGFLDHGQPSRPATTSCSFENRFGLVGKTTLPSSTFPVVDKPAPGETRTSWLNENGLSRQRQEALSFALGDSTRAFETLGSPVCPFGRLGNSVSHLPSDGIRASGRKNVLSGIFGERPRDEECISNETIRSHRKSLETIERDMFAWKVWSGCSKVHESHPNLLYETERESRDCLYRGVGDLRVLNDNNDPELRRSSVPSGCFAQLNPWNSSRTTCRSNCKSTIVIDGSVDGESASKRSIGRSGVLVHARNSVATQADFAIRSSHKSTQTETEHVAEGGRISWPINLRSVDRAAGSDRQIRRTVSATVCTSQIRVVSVNTEFRTNVEKLYTSRAVSPSIPIRNPRAKYTTVVSSSSSDVVLAAVSDVPVQQVQELPKVSRPSAVNEKNYIASPGRDPCPRKFESRPAAENLASELCGLEEDGAILLESEGTRRLHSPTATGKVALDVLTDNVSKSPRVLYRNLAISRRSDKSSSKLDHQVVSVQTRSGKARSSSMRANETSPRDVSESYAYLAEEELSNEKQQETGKLSVSRRGLCVSRKNRGSSAMSVALRDSKRLIQARTLLSTKLGRKAREFRRPTGAGVAVRPIVGMMSSPEDFFCDT